MLARNPAYDDDCDWLHGAIIGGLLVSRCIVPACAKVGVADKSMWWIDKLCAGLFSPPKVLPLQSFAQHVLADSPTPQRGTRHRRYLLFCQEKRNQVWGRSFVRGCNDQGLCGNSHAGSCCGVHHVPWSAPPAPTLSAPTFTSGSSLVTGLAAAIDEGSRSIDLRPPASAVRALAKLWQQSPQRGPFETSA